MRVVAIIVLSLSTVGCWGQVETPFPDGLIPLEENPLPLPMGTADTPLPTEIRVEGVPGRPYDSVYARGFIDAPLDAVWGAWREPVVGVDRRSVSEWSVETIDDPQYALSYVVRSIRFDIVNVEWWTTWRQGVVDGTADDPTLVAIRWQKTDGASILRVIEGSLVLRAIGDGSVTELDLVYHADALGAGLEDYVRYIEEMLGDFRAVLRGEPLPELP